MLRLHFRPEAATPAARGGDTAIVTALDDPPGDAAQLLAPRNGYFLLQPALVHGMLLILDPGDGDGVLILEVNSAIMSASRQRGDGQALLLRPWPRRRMSKSSGVSSLR